MAQAISFPSTTANMALPLLFSGQAQKEFILNQSFAVLDALMAASVEAAHSAPPQAPEDGQCYLVAENATGAWAGHEDQIAARIGASWHFVTPIEGMEVFDRSSGQRAVFKSQWQFAAAPADPQGGATVDAEARAALTAIISALKSFGVFAEEE